MLKVKIFYQFCCDYGANIYLIKTDISGLIHESWPKRDSINK